MAKNIDKQAIENMSDNFSGYAALLRKVKMQTVGVRKRCNDWQRI